MLGIGRRQSGGDPFFSSVVLLALNESGADGGTTFVDQSNSGHTLTANGNFQWDTAQAPTGLTSSGLLDGSGDFLSALDHDDWNLAAGDFAIDVWSRIPAVTANDALVAQNGAAGNRSWDLVWRGGLTRWRFIYSTDGTATVNADFADTLSNNTWYHFAIARDGVNLRAYRDGAQKGSTHNIGTSTLFDSTATLMIGRGIAGSSGEDFTGHLAAARITKGSNRGYTGTTITVPDLPLPTS